MVSETTSPAPAVTEVIVDGLIERGLVRPADRQHGIDLVSAALAGCTVVELPVARRETEVSAHWTVNGSHVSALATSGSQVLVGSRVYSSGEAREIAAAMLAAAEIAVRLASESSGDGGHDG